MNKSTNDIERAMVWFVDGISTTLTADLTGEVHSDLQILAKRVESFTEYDTLDELLRSLVRCNTSDKMELGMNTFGIMLDRLTILSCKSKLSTSPNDRIKAQQQILNVVAVLTSCGRGDPTLLAKEQVNSTNEFDLKPARSMIQLLKANIGMWLNQDLLYTKSPWAVSELRLRQYLEFFSLENSLRNSAISSLDNWFNIEIRQKGHLNA